MTDSERLAAIAAIMDLKAKYWRGVDTFDAGLVRSILAEDCVLDYMGCCTDPVSGTDHFAQMNLIMRGRESWRLGDGGKPGHVTVHQGHQCEIAVTGADTATGIWAFTDRFFMGPGAPFSRLTGYGHYHDTYVRTDGRWLLATTRITRLRVESE